jgi:DNA/RNA-binding domain of Phe-tRNA-synthetase-like protein
MIAKSPSSSRDTIAEKEVVMDRENRIPIELDVDSDVGARIRLGIVWADPVVTTASAAALDAEMQALAGSLREKFARRSPSEIAPLAWARELYKAFGIDPTRTRPSSEALLRRVLKDKPLPRILNAVDLCNLCSLRFLLPLGLYDGAKIRSPVRLRRGRPGEAYEGIRKNEVHLEGRLVLGDQEGAFGNPTSDSLRTSVDPGTTTLWMVVFAPASYPSELMEENVRFARCAMERHLAPEGGAVATAGAGWGNPTSGSVG